MKRNILLFVLFLFLFLFNSNNVLADVTCEYSLSTLYNADTVSPSSDDDSLYLANHPLTRILSYDSKLTMTVKDEFTPNSGPHVSFSISSDNWSFAGTQSEYSAIVESNGDPEYGYDQIVTWKTCPSLYVLYDETSADKFSIYNVKLSGSAVVEDLSDLYTDNEYFYDLAKPFIGASTVPRGLKAAVIKKSGEQSEPDPEQDTPGYDTDSYTCEYSLAYVQNWEVSPVAAAVRTGNYIWDIKAVDGTLLETDSILYMNVNGEFSSDAPNITFSTSDEIYSLGGDQTQYSASKFLTLSSDKELYWYSTLKGMFKLCPRLAIIHRPSDTIYGRQVIENISFTNENEFGDQVELTLNSLLSSYASDPDSLPGNYYFSYISKYDAETNSLKSAMARKHPEIHGKDDEDDESFTFCGSKGVLKVFKTAHIFIIIAKIMVPIILIVVGSISFFNAMMADDAKAIHKATSDLIRNLIIAVVVFFIPTIVNSVMSLVTKDDSPFSNCKTCLSDTVEKCDILIDSAGDN